MAFPTLHVAENCCYPQRELERRSVAYTRMKLYGPRAATAILDPFESTGKVLLRRPVMWNSGLVIDRPRGSGLAGAGCVGDFRQLHRWTSYHNHIWGLWEDGLSVHEAAKPFPVCFATRISLQRISSPSPAHPRMSLLHAACRRDFLASHPLGGRVRHLFTDCLLLF